jgi:hypothetical protein
MDDRSSRLPSALPPWLTPARVGVLAVPAGAVAMIAPVVAALRPLGFGWWTTCGVAAAGAALTALAVRARTPGRAALWLAAGGVVAGLLGFVLSVQLAHWRLCMWTVDDLWTCGSSLTGLLDDDDLFLRTGLRVHLALDVSIGAALGVAGAALSAAVVRTARRGDHDSADCALILAGVWLAVGGAGAALAGVALAREVPLAVLGTTLLVAGAGAAFLGARARAARDAWLARVLAGRVRDWAIEPPCDEDAEALALLPPCDGALCGDVLVHRPPLAAGPYRGDARARVAVARLDPGLASVGTAGWAVSSVAALLLGFAYLWLAASELY